MGESPPARDWNGLKFWKMLEYMIGPRPSRRPVGHPRQKAPMPAWKVLLVGVLTCSSLGLAMATVAIPIAQEGSQRWLWLGGLLSATAVTGTLLALFLRHASGSLEMKPRWAKR